MEEKNLKNVMYILIAVAVALAGTLAYIWYQKYTLVNELTLEKEELTAQMIDLQNDYATLSSDYDTINSQLDSSREEVSQLIERIKKTEYDKCCKCCEVEKVFDCSDYVFHGSEFDYTFMLSRQKSTNI